MNKITEIVSDDFPDWAKEAFDKGQFFRTAVDKVANQQATISELVAMLKKIKKGKYAMYVEAIDELIQKHTEGK